MWKRILAVDGGGDDTEGCGAAWGCEHSGVVFCYGEVAGETGDVCEERQDCGAVF